MAISFNSTSSVNSFFNTSLGVKSSNTTGSINDLLTSGSITEYATIKSGTYKKLLSAYYAKDNSSEVASKKETLNNQGISTDASSASSALIDLKKMDITEENKDEVLEKAKEFAKVYNSVVDKLVDSDTKSVLQKGVWMTKAVSSYSNVLGSVGIQVEADNKLTIDDEKFKNANVEQLKSVFKGNMSVGSKISYKINQVENIALNNGTTNYTSSGTSSTYSSVSTFDKFL